jgi:hypothetical protein
LGSDASAKNCERMVFPVLQQFYPHINLITRRAIGGEKESHDTSYASRLSPHEGACLHTKYFKVLRAFPGIGAHKRQAFV